MTEMARKILEFLVHKLEDAFGRRKNAEGLAELLASKAPELSEAELSGLAMSIITKRNASSFPPPKELIAMLQAVPAIQQRAGNANKERTGLFDPLTKTAPNKGPHEKRTHEKTYRIGGRDRWFGYGAEAENLRVEADDEAEKQALRFLRGRTITEEAITGGWAAGLLDFVIREGREPNPTEEQSIIAKVRRNDAAARDFIDMFCIAPLRGNVTSRQMLPIGHGLGDRLRKLRAAMHEAAVRKLTRSPINAGK